MIAGEARLLRLFEPAAGESVVLMLVQGLLMATPEFLKFGHVGTQLRGALVGETNQCHFSTVIQILLAFPGADKPGAFSIDTTTRLLDALRRVSS